MKTRKYIITDPCYIMDEEQYHSICDQRVRAFENPFEEQEFPLASTDSESKRPIFFWTISDTPNGDGSYVRTVKSKDGSVREEEILVDAGMLCVAEDPLGWEKDCGATFATLKGALAALPKILKRF